MTSKLPGRRGPTDVDEDEEDDEEEEAGSDDEDGDDAPPLEAEAETGEEEDERRWAAAVDAADEGDDDDDDDATDSAGFCCRELGREVVAEPEAPEADAEEDEEADDEEAVAEAAAAAAPVGLLVDDVEVGRTEEWALLLAVVRADVEAGAGAGAGATGAGRGASKRRQCWRRTFSAKSVVAAMLWEGSAAWFLMSCSICMRIVVCSWLNPFSRANERSWKKRSRRIEEREGG